MKKQAVTPEQATKKLEEVMTARFKGVFDSLVRLNEQWERALKQLERTNATEHRVTRMVLREHNQRIKTLERRAPRKSV